MDEMAALDKVIEDENNQPGAYIYIHLQPSNVDVSLSIWEHNTHCSHIILTGNYIQELLMKIINYSKIILPSLY